MSSGGHVPILNYLINEDDLAINGLGKMPVVEGYIEVSYDIFVGVFKRGEYAWPIRYADATLYRWRGGVMAYQWYHERPKRYAIAIPYAYFHKLDLKPKPVWDFRVNLSLYEPREE